MKAIAKLQIVVAALMVLATLILGIKNVVLYDFAPIAILIATAFIGLTAGMLYSTIKDYKQLKKQQ